MLSANFKPKRIAPASRGFLAIARLSCLFCRRNGVLEDSYWRTGTAFWLHKFQPERRSGAFRLIYTPGCTCTVVCGVGLKSNQITMWEGTDSLMSKVKITTSIIDIRQSLDTVDSRQSIKPPLAPVTRACRHGSGQGVSRYWSCCL